MDNIQQVARDAAHKAANAFGRSRKEDDPRLHHEAISDAVVVAVLHQVTEAMTEKLTPALNTGTAFDLLVIVGQVIRDLGAAFTPAEPPQQEAEVLRAAEADTVADPRADLSAVSAPPPIAQDWQVSLENGPDYDPRQFTGGVESIERKGSMLVFTFAAGGQITVNHGVTYVSPERH